MDDALKGLGPGSLVLVTKVLFDGTVSIAAAGNTNSASVDCAGFASGFIYADSAQQFDLRVEISDDNTDWYMLSENLNVAAGKHIYKVDVRGAKYIRINVTNDGVAAMTPSYKIALCTR